MRFICTIASREQKSKSKGNKQEKGDHKMPVSNKVRKQYQFQARVITPLTEEEVAEIEKGKKTARVFNVKDIHLTSIVPITKPWRATDC